jgi:ligand-binding sensor domain-containing protein
MNKKTGTFTRYLNIPGNIHSLANNKVRAIFEDNQGVLWIGTGGNGLHKMDRKQGTFERIVYDPAHPEKISGPAFKKESSQTNNNFYYTGCCRKLLDWNS